MALIRRLLLAIALTVVATSASAQQRGGSAAVTTDRAPTPAELRESGQRAVQGWLDQYGRGSAADSILVGSVLEPLRRAAGYDRRDFEWHVVKIPALNARAMSGGFMLVNTGTITALTSIADLQYPTDSDARDARVRAYLASILGHELAHLVLGHTERTIPQLRTRQDTLRELGRSRDREIAADATGALFALRADWVAPQSNGWSIQTAMDLFHVLDSLEHASGQTAQMLTWFIDHPRSSEREARLEASRAALKLDQSRFDDAYALVMHGQLLDTAVTLLDTVIAHFPDLAEAHHLRAAAFHQRFLDSVPVQNLKVQSAVPIYDSHFVQRIRAGLSPEAERALESARAGYAETLRRTRLPRTLSNLAVLDAYAGAAGLAGARADSAVALDGNDPAVLQNRGVVRYLAKDYQLALADFKAAQAKSAEPTAALAFDIGRAMVELNLPSGRDSLAAYAHEDDEGPWHALAESLSGGAATRTQRGAASSPSTPVAFGAHANEVRAALGAPDEVSAAGASAEVWRYRKRGIVSVSTKQDGVVMLALMTPTAGSIDGVKVGDPIDRTRVWGRPLARDGHTYRFRRGALMLAVDEDGGTITRIAIHRR